MELHRQWELLLEKMREKGVKLLQAQKLVQYLRECEDVMDWINDKVGGWLWRVWGFFVFCFFYLEGARLHPGSVFWDHF